MAFLLDPAQFSALSVFLRHQIKTSGDSVFSGLAWLSHGAQQGSCSFLECTHTEKESCHLRRPGGRPSQEISERSTQPKAHPLESLSLALVFSVAFCFLPHWALSQPRVGLATFQGLPVLRSKLNGCLAKEPASFLVQTQSRIQEVHSDKELPTSGAENQLFSGDPRVWELSYAEACHQDILSLCVQNILRPPHCCRPPHLSLACVRTSSFDGFPIASIAPSNSFCT